MQVVRLVWRALGRIAARRVAFEAFLMVAAVLSGASGFWVEAARSRSLVSVLPAWAQSAYYVVLLVGGLAGLTGLMTKDLETGLRTERAALIILTGHTSAFGCAAVAYSGPAGIPGAIMLLGFGTASLVRIYQIRADLVTYREFIARAAREQAP